MHILLFSYELPPLGGGVGTAISHLLDEWLEDEDLTITLITSSLDNSFTREKPHPQLTIQRVPLLRSKHDSLGSQRILDQAAYAIFSTLLGVWYKFSSKPDLAVSFGYPGPLATYILSWLGLPFIHALRGVDVPGYNPRFNWGFPIHRFLSRILWNRATALTTNSSWLKKRAQATGSDTEIHVIPNGVDTSLFQSVSDDKKFEKFTVTAGGTLFNQKKQLDQLIRGYHRFIEENQLQPAKNQLLLIGTGPQENELRSLVTKLQLDSYVAFTGKKDRSWIAKNLPRCHVFCLPSLAEGMSNASLEALAAGLPLIMTDVGGAKDIIDKNGILLKSADVDKIASSIGELHNDPQRRSEMAKRSRAIAMTMTWATVAEQYQKNFSIKKNQNNV